MECNSAGEFLEPLEAAADSNILIAVTGDNCLQLRKLILERLYFPTLYSLYQLGAISGSLASINRPVSSEACSRKPSILLNTLGIVRRHESLSDFFGIRSKINHFLLSYLSPFCYCCGSPINPFNLDEFLENPGGDGLFPATLGAGCAPMEQLFQCFDA